MVDLDASVVILDAFGTVLDAVYFNKLSSDCGGVVHSGDQRDGSAAGYDEVVSIDGAKLDLRAAYLAVLINSFDGKGF